jgi:hypothetical protein
LMIASCCTNIPILALTIMDEVFGAGVRRRWWL